MSQATMNPPSSPAMNSRPAPAGTSPFMKFAAPALVIGFVLGLFAGVFAGPMLDGWMSRSSAGTPEKTGSSQRSGAVRPVEPDERTLPQVAPTTGAPTDPAPTTPPASSGAGSPTSAPGAPATGGEPAPAPKPAPGR